MLSHEKAGSPVEAMDSEGLNGRKHEILKGSSNLGSQLQGPEYFIAQKATYVLVSEMSEGAGITVEYFSYVFNSQLLTRTFKEVNSWGEKSGIFLSFVCLSSISASFGRRWN